MNTRVVPPPRQYDTPTDEILDRLRRTETRLANFCRYFGVDPATQFEEKARDEVVVNHGELYCITPNASIGDLMYAARRNKLVGDVVVNVAGRPIGKIRVNIL